LLKLEASYVNLNFFTFKA